MSVWMVAFIALVPPFGVCAYHVLRGDTPHRLVALELASAIASLMLVLTSVGFGQPSFIDLALALSLLGLIGTLVLAQFLERWL